MSSRINSSQHTVESIRRLETGFSVRSLFRTRLAIRSISIETTKQMRPGLNNSISLVWCITRSFRIDNSNQNIDYNEDINAPIINGWHSAPLSSTLSAKGPISPPTSTHRWSVWRRLFLWFESVNTGQYIDFFQIHLTALRAITRRNVSESKEIDPYSADGEWSLTSIQDKTKPEITSIFIVTIQAGINSLRIPIKQNLLTLKAMQLINQLPSSMAWHSAPLSSIPLSLEAYLTANINFTDDQSGADYFLGFELSIPDNTTSSRFTWQR